MGFEQISTLYVSQQNGDDWDCSGISKVNDCLSNGPLQSIERALEIVADMRTFKYNQPVRIVLLDDVYYVTKPIVIDERMSGVTITSDCNTLLSGGKLIEGFVADTFNGKKCFSAPIAGIDDGYWFTDLYVDGKRADFTCYPTEGLLSPKAVENDIPEQNVSSKWFIAKDDDLKLISGFKNFGDCFISFNHYWVDEHTPIESFDLDNGKIVFAYQSRYTIALDTPLTALAYKIENVREAFQNPNEWYLDRETKKVYYIPRDEKQTPDSIKAFAPVTDKIFIVRGRVDAKVNNINFTNLRFANTRGDYRSTDRYSYMENPVSGESESGYAADVQSVCSAPGTIEYFFAHGCRMEGCTLSNLGIHAVTINDGCDLFTIDRNYFRDLGAGGIKINGSAGDDIREATHGITITNNTITECGKRYNAACGVLGIHTYENLIAHNEISYLYYTGISLGWIWGYKPNVTRDNIIEYNHVHHIGLGKLSDMGAIYTLGIQPGTVIRNNIVHDVLSKCAGGYGIYTDEGSSLITIENNIVYKVSCSGLHQHYGSMNVVRNNIFAKSAKKAIAFSRPEFHVGGILENNIIVSDGASAYRSGWLDHENSSATGMIRGRANIFFDTKGSPAVYEIAGIRYGVEDTQKTFGIEYESIEADPLFQDLENDNYALQDNSPAYKIGFKKIDIDKVGPTR